MLTHYNKPATISSCQSVFGIKTALSDYEVCVYTKIGHLHLKPALTRSDQPLKSYKLQVAFTVKKQDNEKLTLLDCLLIKTPVVMLAV